MKKLNVLAVSAALLGSGWVFSVNPVSADHKEMSAEEHVKELKSKLKLSPEQETQIREIVQEKMHKVQDAKEEAHDKIRTLLNDDQKSKFNDLMLDKEKKEKQY